MNSQEKALFVFSGKMLDRPFSLDILDSLRAGIERALSDQDVIVTRRVATLSTDRFLAAPYFLQAGFEVVPADDEDMQASALLMEAAMTRDSSRADAVVFSLGESEPVHLLRLLAGKTRRALVFDGELSEEIAANLEMAFDVRGVLSKEGVDVAKVHFQPWEEWSAVLDAQLSDSEVAEQPQAAESVGTRQASVARPSVDELCETQPAQEYELFERSAAEWNAELERLVLERDGKCSAWSAVQILAEKFPGIDDFYLNRRDEFAALLDGAIKFIPQDGENSTSCFYHRSHESMRPISAERAIELINFDAGSARVENEELEHGRSDEPTFESIAEMAKIMAEQCRWSIERGELPGGPEVAARDRELEDLARPYNIFFWQRRAVELYDFTPEQYDFVAKCYDHVERVYRFVGECMSDPESVAVKQVQPLLQLAATAQCLLKSTLSKYNVPIVEDSVQRAAFNFLSDFRKQYFPREYLYNMKREEYVSLDILDSERENLEQRKIEVSHSMKRVRKVNDLLSRIKYEAGQIEKRPESEFAAQKWANIVESTTALCRDFSEPFSSIRLRDILYSIVDDVPEYVETTDEFARVVQEIDLYKAKEEEEFNWAKASKDDEDVDDFNPEILAVRKRYDYGKVVFVGGTPQNHLRQRLENKLHVELIWFETDHGDSLDRFNRYINDEDVKLFLVYIPWCSHKHSIEFSYVVRNAGKDFVRIPKGTSPETIAHHICDQLNLSIDEFLPNVAGSDELSNSSVDAA